MGKKSWLYAYTGAVLSPRKKAFLKRFEKAAQIHEVADWRSRLRNWLDQPISGGLFSRQNIPATLINHWGGLGNPYMHGWIVANAGHPSLTLEQRTVRRATQSKPTFMNPGHRVWDKKAPRGFELKRRLDNFNSPPHWSQKTMGIAIYEHLSTTPSVNMSDNLWTVWEALKSPPFG